MATGATQGAVHVAYPAEGQDWEAGTLSRTLTFDFQRGTFHAVLPWGRYDWFETVPNPLPGVPSPYGADDVGIFPMDVSPAASGAALPKTNLDDTRRLAFLLVTGSNIPSFMSTPQPAPYTTWECDFPTQGVCIPTIQPGGDFHLETADAARFAVELIDAGGRRATEACFRLHRCPRFDHDGPIPERSGYSRPCTLVPVDSIEGRIAEVVINPNGAAAPDSRGYLGIELTQAPVEPGTYYVVLSSLDKTYRLRQQGQLNLDGSPDGVYLGAWALCNVSGGEILDENFQRFPNGIVTNQPIRAYLRILTPRLTDLPAVELSSSRSDGTTVDSGVGLTLARLGNTTVAMGEFAVVPDGWSGGLPPGPPLRIPLGSGRVVAGQVSGSRGARAMAAGAAATGGGPQLAQTSSVFPYKLTVRFLKRGCLVPGIDSTLCITPSPDGDPTKAGQDQETEVEKLTHVVTAQVYYEERVDLLVEARNPNRITDPVADVSDLLRLQEFGNADYKDATGSGIFRDFFNGEPVVSGRSCSTKIATDGSVAAPFGSPGQVRLEHGRAVLSLWTAGATRLRATTGDIVESNAANPYSTTLRVRPSNPLCPPAVPCEDWTDATIRLWVDERTLVRTAGGSMEWSSAFGPDGALDWLELRAMEYVADPSSARIAGAADVHASMDNVVDAWTLTGGIVGQVLPWQPRIVRLKPSWYAYRNPLASMSVQTLGYFGLTQTVPAWALFDSTISHEARHCWQFGLRLVQPSADIDGDGVVSSPPVDSPELTDAPYDALGSGSGFNPEVDLLGDVGPATNDVLYNAGSVRVAQERNAMRFAQANCQILGDPGFSLACATFSWQDVRCDQCGGGTVGPAALLGTVTYVSAPPDQVTGMVVRLERATAGISCSDAGGWALVEYIRTTTGGSVAFGKPVPGLYRLVLVAPRECPGGVPSGCIEIQ